MRVWYRRGGVGERRERGHVVVMLRQFASIVAAFWLLLVVIGPGTARADGDDFFLKTAKPLGSQLIFVGTVRDDAGNRVSGALVTWETVLVDGEQEEPTSAGTYSNIIGRFRTMDVADVIAKYGFVLDPNRVTLVAAKPGYTMLRSLRRTRQSQRMGLVEIDFVLKKSAETPPDPK